MLHHVASKISRVFSMGVIECRNLHATRCNIEPTSVLALACHCHYLLPAEISFFGSEKDFRESLCKLSHGCNCEVAAPPIPDMDRMVTYPTESPALCLMGKGCKRAIVTHRRIRSYETTKGRSVPCAPSEAKSHSSLGCLDRPQCNAKQALPCLM